MNKEYNNFTASAKPKFLITDHVEFDNSGRALCPACSPNHKKKSRTLSIVPNGNGAYKCFRGCTPEEIRESLGQPKVQIIPTALACSSKTTTKKNIVDEVRVIQSHSELLSLKGAGLDAIRWLANRGITTDLAKHYKLGIARARSLGKMVYSITIPIETEVKGQYYIKKRICPWDNKVAGSDDYKPWSQFGIPKTIYFTHKPEKATQTWLCEGEWDAMMLGWLVSHHRDDVAVASFTCGANSVPPNQELARLPGEVIIFYDRNDNLTKDGKRPGEEGAKKVAQALGSRAKIAAVPMPENSTVKGWDVSDAINHGYQLESFERAVLVAENYDPSSQNSFLARARKLTQIFNEAPDYVDWLVPDLFTTNELYCLAAEPRAGKSLFALGLAKAVSSGTEFLGRPCQKGEVVYICKEDPDDKVKERLLAQEWKEAEMDNVLVDNEFTLDELPELRAYVKEAKPSLIIFDTLSRIQTSNGKENSSEIADTLAPLQDLAQQENVCVLVVHHTRKRSNEHTDFLDIFDSVRGSGAIRATCRGMLVLAKAKQGFRLAVENGRTQAQDLAIHLNISNLTWKLNGLWTPPHVNKTQKDLVLEWLEKHREGTIAQIYNGTLIRKKYIYDILTRLISEGFVEREGSQRTTLYYLRVPQVPLAEDEWNSQTSDTERAKGMSSTTSRKTQKCDQSDQDCNGLLHPDHFSSDQPEKRKKVELEPKTESNVVTVGDVEIPQSSTKASKVELNGQKVNKAIGENSIVADQVGDTTNFFDSQSPDAESETDSNQEEKRLVGVWHKKEGYVRVVSVNGSRLTVRRSGETKTKTIYLRACDNRREYETHCEF